MNRHPRPGSSGKLPTAPGRILLVEDEPSTLDVLCGTLESAGHTVLVATSGAAGLRAARRSRPDLIVMDVRLPGMGGFEACRRLRANPPTASIPVVFLTALEESGLQLRGRDAGGVEVIRKRQPWDEVAERIEGHLRRATLQRGKQR